MMNSYSTKLSSGSHWSLVVRRGMQMNITDLTGGANVGMLFYNPALLTEKYNAPDSLKCQHTFKLTAGHCLYSDMGRIFCSITADSFGWHETICGTSHASHVNKKWGKRDYQTSRNKWQQNGYDSFLVEIAKYGLSKVSLAANVNWFSQVSTDERGNLSLSKHSSPGDNVQLRFEMDTLVVIHTCPHPFDNSEKYPRFDVGMQLEKAPTMSEDDLCMNTCDENKRGFENNALYHLGLNG